LRQTRVQAVIPGMEVRARDASHRVERRAMCVAVCVSLVIAREIESLEGESS
jgi:hypothetical protein